MSDESKIASEFLLLKSSVKWLRVWQFMLLIGLVVNAAFIIQVPLSSNGTVGASVANDGTVDAHELVVDTADAEGRDHSSDASDSADIAQTADDSATTSDEIVVIDILEADTEQRPTQLADTPADRHGIQLGAVVRGTAKAWLRVAKRRAVLVGSLTTETRPTWPAIDPSRGAAQETASSPTDDTPLENPSHDAPTPPLPEVTEVTEITEVTAEPSNRFAIVNPDFNEGEVRFLLDNEVRSLASGESLELTGREDCVIVFHRGGDFGTFRQTLQPGVYEFQVTDHGWTVQQVD